LVAVVALLAAEALRLKAPDLGEWVNAPPAWRALAFAPLVWKLRIAAAVAGLAALLLVARPPPGRIAGWSSWALPCSSSPT
jgi:hypothetical protein